LTLSQLVKRHTRDLRTTSDELLLLESVAVVAPSGTTPAICAVLHH
jgi:hypothetical protein